MACLLALAPSCSLSLSTLSTRSPRSAPLLLLSEPAHVLPSGPQDSTKKGRWSHLLRPAPASIRLATHKDLAERPLELWLCRLCQQALIVLRDTCAVSPQCPKVCLGRSLATTVMRPVSTGPGHGPAKFTTLQAFKTFLERNGDNHSNVLADSLWQGHLFNSAGTLSSNTVQDCRSACSQSILHFRKLIGGQLLQARILAPAPAECCGSFSQPRSATVIARTHSTRSSSAVSLARKLE